MFDLFLVAVGGAIGAGIRHLTNICALARRRELSRGDGDKYCRLVRHGPVHRHLDAAAGRMRSGCSSPQAFSAASPHSPPFRSISLRCGARSDTTGFRIRSGQRPWRDSRCLGSLARKNRFIVLLPRLQRRVFFEAHGTQSNPEKCETASVRNCVKQRDRAVRLRETMNRSRNIDLA